LPQSHFAVACPRYIKRRAKWEAKFGEQKESNGGVESAATSEGDTRGDAVDAVVSPDERGIVISAAVLADVPDVHRMIMELAIVEKEPDQVSLSCERLGQDIMAGRCWCIIAHAHPVKATVLRDLPSGNPDYDGLTYYPGGEFDPLRVGFALGYTTYSTWEGHGLYLEDLYVSPEYRAKGVGSKLLRAVAKKALDAGCCRLQWQCIDWNTDAMCFYEKKVGAVQRIETDDAKWINYIMRIDAMEAWVEGKAAGEEEKEGGGQCEAGQEDPAGVLFDSWDRDKNGSLSHGELKKGMKTDVHLAAIVSSKGFHWSGFFRKHDVDENGTISRDEFISLLNHLDITLVNS